MRLRSSLITAGVAALLGLGLPVQAQVGQSETSFDGVAFAFDVALGSSVNITRVPGQPPNAQQPGGPDAPHVAFTLYGPRDEGARVPRVGFSSGVLRAYRTADIAGYEEASGQLEALEALLGDRPDLGVFMAVPDDSGGERLPHLPVDLAAAQVLRARATYVDTPELSGIAYLAAYRQDVAPFTTGDFWYTFQGLSADGAWYVAADFVVEAGMFPRRVSVRQVNRVADRWVSYLTESTSTLNDAGPDEFTPNLTSVDALVQSITFSG
ncbi:hypothetical protein BH24CHL9_BH24CHL9_16370 [soil metagenome]